MTADQHTALRREIEELRALSLLQSGRIAVLEESNAELRASANLDPLPVETDHRDFVTPQQAAYALGLTVPAVYKRIKKGKLEARKLGGRLLIHRNSAGQPRKLPGRASKGPDTGGVPGAR